MTQITIIGSGFAGLTAVREIRKQLPKAKITLVSPLPEFIYLPSLIWIPSGLRQPEDLRIDLTRFFQRHRVDHHPGRLLGVTETGKGLLTDKGELSTDYLLIACGGRFIKKLPGIEHTIALCEGIDAAVRIRDRLASMEGGTIAFGFGGNPKEPAAMRGGPMFELLFGTDTLLRQQGRRDRFELVFFAPAKQPGKRLGEAAVKKILQEMDKRQIKTHLGHKIKGFEADKVITEGGEFRSDLTLFMPGMTGPEWAANSPFPLSAGGLIQADEFCQVPGFEGSVYIAGDAGSFPGPEWMPKQAHMADLQAKAAVANMALAHQGQAAAASYTPELACIIDTLKDGILVFRRPDRKFMARSRLFHYAKRLFEWWYLRPYRK
jgi:sulfide:quinone oxidoreductase